MSTVIDMAQEQRSPLIDHSSSSPLPRSTNSLNDGDDIAPTSSSDSPDASTLGSTHQNQRIVSLDVFRGLSVAVSLPISNILTSNQSNFISIEPSRFLMA